MEARLNEFNKISNKKKDSTKDTNNTKKNVILKEQYCLKMLDYMVF